MASEVVSWKLWNNALPIILYGSLAVQIKIDFYLKECVNYLSKCFQEPLQPIVQIV